jgi:hypothetical protein
MALNARKSDERMNLGTFHAHDVVNLNPAYRERIGDERAVAPPWNRFRTHNCAPLLPGQFDQSVQPCFKCRGLHIVSKPAKRGIAPAHVRRIVPCVAQAPELSQMHVAYPRASQLFRKDFPVELRVVSGSGDSAHIYDARDAMRSQKLQEVFPCAIRMPNREDSWHSDFYLSHDEDSSPASPLQAMKVDHRNIGTPIGNFKAANPVRAFN